MSVFHRVDPDAVETLTAAQFWPRARRLSYYDGAVRAIALTEARGQQTASSAASTPDEPSIPVDPTPEQIRAMRDAARRKRYPAAQFGEVRYVTDQEIVRRAGTSG